MQNYSSSYYTPGFYFTKYGEMYILFYRGKVIITVGPHCNLYLGPILLAFNILILSIHLVTFFALLPKFAFLKYLCSISLTFLQVSFIYCGLKDPGIMFPSMEMELGSNKYCHKCGADNHGHHCTICEVCIEGHDHHCGFVGKCIGKGNIQSFYSLLVGVFFSSMLFMITLGWRTWSLGRDNS